jgi:hypothetical protein
MVRRFVKKLLPRALKPERYIEDLVKRRTELAVRAGPFAGMRYLEQTYEGALIPKLLGLYERDLSPYVEFACGLQVSKLVNVGGGEGYYAVGMARRNPQARVIVFEMESTLRCAIQRLAQLNGVGARIEIRGKCRPEDLAAELAEPEDTVVICDVEGDEAQIIDPEKVPGLRDAYVVVETHNFRAPGVAELLTTRLEGTHQIQRIWQTERSPNEFPFSSLYLSLIPQWYLHAAVTEWRAERTCWLWMMPKSKTACPRGQ